jgi:polyhydroxybutyrate depolymerase
MARTVALAVTVAAALLAYGCGGGSSPAAGLCRPGDHRLGAALVHVPASAGGQRAPLLVAAHGDGFTGPRLARALGLSDAADRRGLIVLYPTAPHGSWIPRAGAPDQSRAVLGQVDAVVHAGCASPDRVAAAGFSSGASLVARMACRARGRLTAVVAIAGYYRDPAACAAGRASVLAIHGTADPTIPYRTAGVGDWLRRWARQDRCAGTPVTSSVAQGVARVRWPACADGRSVEELRLTGAGHGWPGEPVLAAPGPAVPVDATAEIVRLSAGGGARTRPGPPRSGGR